MLGKGGFARVYGVRSLPNGSFYACKIVTRSSLTKKSQRQKLRYEIKIHQKLNHKHVVKFQRHFEDKERVYILLEYCNNQTLMEVHKRRRKITEPETQYYMHQILDGVAYLHSRRVIHRDLKLGNILLDRELNVKIADFGLATWLMTPEERKTTICGTPNYIAPEVLNGGKQLVGKKVGHSFEVDIWSLGVIMYTLLVGRPPFQTGTVNKTYNKIRGAVYSYPGGLQISLEAKILVDNMLVVQAETRPTIPAIQKSKFFTVSAIPKQLPLTAIRQRPAGMPALVSDNIWIGYNDNKRKRTDTQANPGGNAPKRANHGVTQPNCSPAIEGDAVPVGGVWIQRWLDYARKYGIGYVMNTGAVGVYFNDYTKILLHPDKRTVTYWGNRLSNQHRTGPPKGERVSVSQYSDWLRKKVTLIKHFADHFQADEKHTPKNKIGLAIPAGKEIYVKECLRTNSAIMFRLNTDSVQMNFKDSTELILHAGGRMVTYTEAKGARRVYKISEIQDKVPIQRRYKYTKDLLKAVARERTRERTK